MKQMKLYSATDKMTSLVSSNPILLMAMSRFGISLGFADKTVKQVCDNQDVDLTTFLAVANFISFGHASIDGISAGSLMHYLDKAHSYFLDFNLPRIRRQIIEAIDCSGRDEVAMLILKFYDEYTEEVRRHMTYESQTVFDYVRGLLAGRLDDAYNIGVFASGHHSIHSKLKELKEIIIRYLPQRDNNLLNAVLFDLINCEEDLIAHCKVEDTLFVPLVEKLEEEVKLNPIPTVESEGNPTDTDTETLSPREREIIACVACGMSNKEIAEKLFISVNTVTTHRRNLAQKLQIHSPAGLAIYAVINKIVDLSNLK